MSFNRKRPFDGQEYYQPEKRARLSPMMELAKTLCADLNTLGESVKKYVEDVEFMCTPLVTHFEKEKSFRDAVLDTLLAITTEQPQKIPHIAGLIQVTNSKEPAVGKIIVEFFHQKAQEFIERAFIKDGEPMSDETGPWNRLKLILRLLSTLSFIISEESLTKIYTQLLTLAIDLQATTPETRNPLAEALYYNTLISLPYLLIYDRANESLIASIKSLISLADTFKIVASSVTITKPFSEFAHQMYESKEIVNLILPAIKVFFGGDIQDSLKIFITVKEDLELLLSKQEKHNLPQFSFLGMGELTKISGLDTGLGSVDGMWRTPRLTFEVYIPVDGLETKPRTDSYLGLLLSDIITDLVQALEYNRKEAARQIITLDLFFREGLFAEPGSNVDRLRAVNQENMHLEDKTLAKSTWKIEDIAVETVLSLLFKLPTASHPYVYFYTTLVEACTVASQAIAPVMGRSIRYFYSSLDSLDFELRLRFLDWLTVQLSNFNFTWKWREWEGDSQRHSASFYHPKISFIRNLINKELRLTSVEKIESTLTPEFHQYLDISIYTPDELKKYYVSLFGDESRLLEVELTFVGTEKTKFFFLRDNIPFEKSTKRLLEALHKDLGREEYDSTLAELKDQVKDYPNSEKMLISLVFQTLCFSGNRSTTHADIAVHANLPYLEELMFTETELKSDDDSPLSDETQQRQEWAIEAILKYWHKIPQNGFLVLDILEAYKLITPISKIKFVLRDTGRVNYGLVNISATESLFRTLSTALYSKQGAMKELRFIINELFSILNGAVSVCNSEGEITLPNVNDDFSETDELNWKYHTVLGFIKAILRKFSDEYGALAQELKDLTKKKVKHSHSSNIITAWIEELKQL